MKAVAWFIPKRGRGLACAAAMFVCWGGTSSRADVVITEVLYDSLGAEAAPNFGEWIEVFNTGPGDVNLAGWSVEKDGLIDGTGLDRIELVQGSGVLCAGQFALIVPAGGGTVANDTAVIAAWHLPPHASVFRCDWQNGHDLDDIGEAIALRTNSGVVADQAIYPDLARAGRSVQVHVVNLDTSSNDQPGNWEVSDEDNSEGCPSPQSFLGIDYAYLDQTPADEIWEEVEPRDAATPGLPPTDLNYAADIGPVMLTSQQVRQAILANVINPSADAGQLCAYDFEAPFARCTTVGTGLDSPTIALNQTTWVVWIDDDPLADFDRAGRIVLLEDATGAITVWNANGWIEINGRAYFREDDDRIDSDRNFFGGCQSSAPGFAPGPDGQPGCDEPDIASDGPDVELTGDAPAGACALGINGGLNLHFKKNRDNFIAALVAKKLVKSDRVLAVGNDVPRKDSICMAIKMMLPMDCDKLYVYVGSHGAKSGKIKIGGLDDLTAAELACKLAEIGATEYCILIQSCYSGSMVPALFNGWILPSGDMIQTLPEGVVVTSSDADHPSHYNPFKYSYFVQAFLDCLKRPEITTFAEAAAWAKEQLEKNRPEEFKMNPTCTPLQGQGILQEEGATNQQKPKNRFYEFQLETAGDPPPPITWGIDPPGILPPGLNLNSASGLISGTPTVGGQYQFVVRMADCCTEYEATMPMVISVIDPAPQAPPLLTVNPELPTALPGNPFRFRIGLGGGVPPYGVQLVMGSLPPGMQLIPAGPDAGLLVGTPQMPFGSNLTVMVFDSGGPQGQQSVRTLSLVIAPAAARPVSFADLNADGTISLDDYAVFQGCMGGPTSSTALNAECAYADWNSDCDVDLQDAASYVNRHSQF